MMMHLIITKDQKLMQSSICWPYKMSILILAYVLKDNCTNCSWVGSGERERLDVFVISAYVT